MPALVSDRIRKANVTVYWAIFVNVSLIAFKMFAGIVGHSAAVIADAMHSFSDLVTDFITLWGVQIAEKPVDKTHAYGHGKLETLASLFVAIILFLVGGSILYNGIVEIYHAWRGEILQRPGWIGFYAAAISIVVKEWLYRYTVKIGEEIESPLVKANAWHHRSDAFSSIGVMVGVLGAILLGEKWRLLDPVAAVIVSFFILKAAASIAFSSGNELAEASLDEEMENKIMEIIKNIPQASHPHNLKTRKIGNNVAITIHIKVDKSLSITEAHDISSEVELKLKEAFGAETFISVHIEPLP